MPDSIEEIISQGQRIERDDNRNGNEQETRHLIIDPLLDCLGWDRFDIRQEYPVQIGSKMNYIDSALYIEDQPKVLLEAKAISKNITDDNIEQLKSYMIQEWVTLGVLTNGKEFNLYYLNENTDSKPEIVPILTEELESLQNSSFTEILRQRNIESGHSISRIKTILELDQIEGWMRNNTDRIDNALSSMSTSSVTADEFINNLFDRSGQQTRSKDTKTNETAHKYTIEIEENGISAQVGGSTQAEAMKKLAGYLIREYDLLKQIDLPYTAGQGETPLLSEGKASEWETDDGYLGNKHVQGDIYIYTNLGSRLKQQRVTKMCQECNLNDPIFDENW